MSQENDRDCSVSQDNKDQAVEPFPSKRLTTTWKFATDFSAPRIYKPNKQILHVEPNADCRLLVSSLLQLNGCVVTSASTAEQAKDFIKRKSFDLYILDNWLPDQSGIKLCRHIRIVHPGARVVFFSGAAYPQDKEEARQAGALEYLIKPDGFSMLPEVVRRLISKSDSSENSLES